MATVDFGAYPDGRQVQNDIDNLHQILKECLQDGITGITTESLSISTTGTLRVPVGSEAAPSYSFTDETGMGLWRQSLNALSISVGGVHQVRITSGAFIIGSSTLTWGTNPNSGTGPILKREADAILSLVNSTNAQEFRVYNTYTDASNNEYGALDWDTNVLKIGTVKNGTGTKRAMTLLGTQIIQDAPGSAPADAALAASQITFWVNEAGNALTVKVKYADGTTVKSGTVALV